QVLNINLGTLVSGSQLVNGFSRELPSLALIKAAIQKQSRDLAKGRAEDTGVSANAFALSPRLGHGLNVLDHNSYETAVHPRVTGTQLFQLIGGPRGQGGQGGLGGAGVIGIRPGR